MTCRASKLSSSTITFARNLTGLPDVSLLSLNHQLMREGSANDSTTTRENWNAVIDELRDAIANGDIPTARSHDPLARLEAARLEEPDTARYYAARNLLTRAADVSTAQQSYKRKMAWKLGISSERFASRWESLIAEADADSSLAAETDFITTWTRNPDNANLLTDRRSLFAYSSLAASQREIEGSVPRRSAVSHFFDFDASTSVLGIKRIGLDMGGSHVEILKELESGEEVTESYRLSVYGRDKLFRYAQGQTESPGSQAAMLETFVEELSLNPDYRYSSSAVAHNAAYRYQCASCGQFARRNAHYCPVVGSPEAIEADLSRAVDPAAPRFPFLPMSDTEYMITNGMLLRTPNMNIIRYEIQSSTDLRFEVETRVDAFSVSGVLHVEYDGDEDSYHIGSPRNIDKRLACSCPDYQATMSCSHMDEVVEYLNATINAETDPEIRVLANGQVLSDIAMEHADSQDEIAVAIAGYPTIKKSFESDPEIFQTMYKQAREDKKKYDEEGGEYPIPYIQENALMGFGTRASGRGFGIEIEYGFPNDMSHADVYAARDAIGSELYRLNLISTPRQQGYGASHGAYNEHHEEGWSYESDFSTSSSDGQQGGEIVSPVMFDEPETWTNIEKICEILNRHGAIANRGSGNHVHVGLKDYDHTVANHNRLLNSFARNEDLIYRLSSSPERGKHRGFGYCRPNTFSSTPYTRVTAASHASNSHGIALNMQSVFGRNSDHIEFRTFDSTLNPAIIQTHIAMSVLMVEGALRGTSSPAPNEGIATLGERLDLNPRRRALTGEAWDETTLGVRKFIDEFIPQKDGNVSDNPLIKQVVSLFAMTKWQTQRSRRLSDLPE
jgi:hypothetical protein